MHKQGLQHKRRGGAPIIQTQPSLYRFSFKQLLLLPYRLCNPPPAVGKVRSFTLTPIFKVRLEDVLDRKHLPPLGLKDFEEWLLFVEQAPENLYFVLWLRDYSARYKAWADSVRAKEDRRRAIARREEERKGEKKTSYKLTWPAADYSPSLADSYRRARETFFAPNSAFELAVPPELLSPFILPPGAPSRDGSGTAPSFSSSLHPDPAVFAPIQAICETRLRASLARCVRAAFTNVGTFRATCGLICGFFLLLLTIPPLTTNFLGHRPRTERLSALPFLWLGLGIILASFRGVCVAVYIFGDFRQLRKFELERPPPPPIGGVLDEKNGALVLANPAQAHLSTYSSSHRHSKSAIQPLKPLTAPPRIQYPYGVSSYYPSGPSSNSLTCSTNSYGRSLYPASTLSRATTTAASIDEVCDQDPSRDLAEHQRAISVSASRRPYSYTNAPRSSPSSNELAPHYQIIHDPRAALNDCSSSQHAEDDEDGTGIYVSPQIPAPDELAALAHTTHDPEAVRAALAAAARLAGVDISEFAGVDIVNIGRDSAPQVIAMLKDGTSVGLQAEPGSSLAGATSGSGGPAGAGNTEKKACVTGVTAPIAAPVVLDVSPDAPEAAKNQTAGFIPPYPYPPTYSIRSRSCSVTSSSVTADTAQQQQQQKEAQATTEGGERVYVETDVSSAKCAAPCWASSSKSRSRSRAARRARSKKNARRAAPDADLEKGGVTFEEDEDYGDDNEMGLSDDEWDATCSRERLPTPPPLGPFDFDALPRDVAIKSRALYAPSSSPEPTMHQHQQHESAFVTLPTLPSSSAHRQGSPPTAHRQQQHGHEDNDGPLDRLYAFFFSASTAVASTFAPAPNDASSNAPACKRESNLPTHRDTSASPTDMDSSAFSGGSHSARSSTLGPSSPVHALGASHLQPPLSLASPASPQGTLVEPENDDSSKGWKKRYSQVSKTPAFGPVTRVLSPVARRAQWEIVVRSFGLSLLISSAIVGGLIAIPVPS